MKRASRKSTALTKKSRPLRRGSRMQRSVLITWPARRQSSAPKRLPNAKNKPASGGKLKHEVRRRPKNTSDAQWAELAPMRLVHPRLSPNAQRLHRLHAHAQRRGNRHLRNSSHPRRNPADQRRNIARPISQPRHMRRHRNHLHCSAARSLVARHPRGSSSSALGRLLWSSFSLHRLARRMACHSSRVWQLRLNQLRGLPQQYPHRHLPLRRRPPKWPRQRHPPPK